MIALREPLLAPTVIAAVAQIPGDPSSWERLGITGLALAATVFIWRYFVGRENSAQIKRDEAAKVYAEQDAKERNRLLEENNRLQALVVGLLRDQITKTEQVALDLKADRKQAARQQEDGLRSLKDITRKAAGPREVTITNDPEHPVPVALPEDTPPRS